MAVVKLMWGCYRLECIKNDTDIYIYISVFFFSQICTIKKQILGLQCMEMGKIIVIKDELVCKVLHKSELLMLLV